MRPQRRCVGCGRIAPKPELLRLAVAEHGAGDARDARSRRAVLDHAAALPGRGAYLCRGVDPQMPASECLARALQRGGIARALRARVTVDPKLVESGGDPARPRGRTQAGELDSSNFSLTP